MIQSTTPLPPQQFRIDSNPVYSSTSLESLARTHSVDSEKESASPPNVKNGKKSSFFQPITFRKTSSTQSELNNPHLIILVHPRRLTYIEEPKHEFLRTLTPPNYPRRKSAEGRQFGVVTDKIAFCDQLAPNNANHYHFMKKAQPPQTSQSVLPEVDVHFSRKSREGNKTRIYTITKQGTSDIQQYLTSGSAASDMKKRKSFANFKDEDTYQYLTPQPPPLATIPSESARKTTKQPTFLVPSQLEKALSPKSIDQTPQKRASMSFTQKFQSLPKEALVVQTTSPNSNKDNNNNNNNTNNKNNSAIGGKQSTSSSSSSSQQLKVQQRQHHLQHHLQQQPVSYPHTQKEFFLKANFLKQSKQEQQESPEKEEQPSQIQNGFQSSSKLNNHSTALSSSSLAVAPVFKPMNLARIAYPYTAHTQSASTVSTTNHQQHHSVHSASFFQSEHLPPPSSTGTQTLTRRTESTIQFSNLIKPKPPSMKSKHQIISEFLESATKPKKSTKAAQNLFSQIYIANNPLYWKNKKRLTISTTAPHTSNSTHSPSKSAKAITAKPANLKTESVTSFRAIPVKTDGSNYHYNHNNGSAAGAADQGNSINTIPISQTHRNTTSVILLPSLQDKKISHTKNNSSSLHKNLQGNNLQQSSQPHRHKRKHASIAYF